MRSSACSLLRSRERSYERGILPRMLEIVPRKKWRICVLVNQLSRCCAHLDPSCGFMGQGKDERLCVGSREQTCQREISALISLSHLAGFVTRYVIQETLSLWKNNAEKAVGSQILVVICVAHRKKMVWLIPFKQQ